MSRAIAERRRIWIAAIVGFAVACPATGWADEETSDEPGTLSFQIENDKIANTDRHYTNGARVSWTSPELRQQLPWLGDALEWIYPFDTGADVRIGVHLGQNIYTPEDISTKQLIPDDRPYAGWLYIGTSLYAEATRKVVSLDIDTLDTLELDVGVVGPASLAEQTQKFVHQITGSQDPKGWNNQLNNEPGIVLVLERKWRSPAYDFKEVDLQADIIPSTGASLGNVNTSASVGAIFRFGRGLDVDYGPPLINSNLSGVSFIDRVPEKYAWYVFGGAGGRFVARDIFLDGNTFSDSHSVDKKLFVGDAQAGAAVVVHGVRISFTHVWLTREFSGQSEANRYGSASVSFRF